MRPIISLILFLAACGSPSSQRTDTDDTDTDTTDTDDTGVVPPTDSDDDNDGFTEEEGDCNDGQPAINPLATDIVGDEIDQNCDGADGYDGDGDGHASLTSGGDDCDDTDNFTFPGAIEIWYDGKAQGCEVGPDEEWADGDQDGDGHEAESVGGDDCLDTNANVSPDEVENNGNSLDDNCNGEVDGLRASLAWNPATDPTFNFTLHDDLHGLSLTMYSMSDVMEVVMLDSNGSISLDRSETDFEDEFTTLTYALTSMYNFSTTGTQCVVWGPRASDLIAFVGSTGIDCAESDPTTW